MKRKITRQSLDELQRSLTILPLGEQEYYVGGGSGTKEDPYTYEEYLQYWYSGTWTGGYVRFSTAQSSQDNSGSRNGGVDAFYVARNNRLLEDVVVTAPRKDNNTDERGDYIETSGNIPSPDEDESPSGSYLSSENYLTPPMVVGGGGVEGAGAGGTMPTSGTGVPSSGDRGIYSTWNVNRAITKLKQDAHTEPTKYCARAVMNAIEAGFGFKPQDVSRVGSAHLLNDEKGYLEKLGFVQLLIETENYVPQKGDIIVFDPVDGHKHGHTAMFDGKVWISDFIQRDQYGGSAYRKNRNKGYTYHRHKSQQQ